MKLNTKPISSPGRAEKYPPPLMRFLRSNVGSKSRGRSRSSPMFIRRRNTHSTNNNSSSGSAIETTQEPSSPKVTCMGQVRVKYSKNQPKKKNTKCTKFQWKKWVKSSICCCHFSKPKCSKPSCKIWVSFFKFRLKRRRKNREESKFSKSNEETEKVAAETEQEEEEESDDNTNTSKEFVRNVIIPPKNALILTRSRSAPYRSSSLAYRFWGSPLINEEETEQKQSKTEDQHEEEEEDEDNNSSTSKRELLCKECDKESSKLEEENEVKIEFLKESEMKTEEEDEITTSTSATASITSVHPLILMRCKSEPARIADKKFDPDSISFWKKQRFGFT